eukprot:scaffold53_cov193-Pinguiococcus_pyrenoidosus.AAC.65
MIFEEFRRTRTFRADSATDHRRHASLCRTSRVDSAPAERRGTAQHPTRQSRSPRATEDRDLSRRCARLRPRTLHEERRKQEHGAHGPQAAIAAEIRPNPELLRGRASGHEVRALRWRQRRDSRTGGRGQTEVRGGEAQTS